MPRDGSASFLAIEHGKTKNARRTVVLTDRVRAILDRRYVQADCPPDGWVFPAADIDEPFNYRSLDSQHDRLIAKLKFTGRVRLYDLRHTALTRLAESDADPFSIQKIAGHSDIRVTSRYVHPTPQHIQKAFDRLAAYNAKRIEERAHSKAFEEKGGHKNGHTTQERKKQKDLTD